MSKPVRISDYLAEELTKVANRDNRSLANLVQHLLTQALIMETTPRAEPVPPPHVQRGAPAEVDPHFKPDFK